MEYRANFRELLLSLKRRCQETSYFAGETLVAFKQQCHKNRVNAAVALFVIYCLHSIVG
jgi:hypothetical protein